MVDKKEDPAPANELPDKEERGWRRMLGGDFWRTVAPSAVAAVVAAVIISLPEFVSELFSGVALALKPVFSLATLADIFFAVVDAAMAALAVIKGWQVLLAGVFIGCVLYFVVDANAKHARNLAALKARHALERDEAEAKRQLNSLAAALQAEIGMLGPICRDRIATIADLLPAVRKKTINPTAGQKEVLKIVGMTIYESNGARIGLLPPRVASAVVGLYALLTVYNTNISGGQLSEEHQRTLEKAANFAEFAVTILQDVIDGKFDS